MCDWKTVISYFETGRIKGAQPHNSRLEMANYLNESVYTHTFTPKEYQVELLESARNKNTIICSSTSSSKAFIVVKLLQEHSWQIRGTHGKKALLILDLQNVLIMTSHVKLLTDLICISITQIIEETEHIKETLKKNQVIISTAEIVVGMLRSSVIEDLNTFNLIVIDDCLYGQRQSFIKMIMSRYNCLPKNSRPRILGLTSGLLSAELQPDRLEAELRRLEKLLNCQVDTSSEIVTLIRLSCRPHEKLIECSKMKSCSLKDEIKAKVSDAKDFLLEHRFDLSEIYADDFLDDYKEVPDPKTVPMQLLNDFIEILDDLGPWCADRAAFNMLLKIEKLKVKVPYERHYLLLCMLSTTLIAVRAICDHAFEPYDELDRVLNFSSPKVLRFLEVLKQFKPPGNKPEPTEKDKPVEVEASPTKIRGKGKGPRRNFIPRPQSEDILCALVFVHNRYKAKSLFGLLCLLSQIDDNFWWVSTLFSLEKSADPMKEPREAELEHKTQEEVLRKFRCHECNILIATSVLEQGCDLPRCNLVVRFDLPTTFHSYIQSKARARAVDAHYILFVNDDELPTFVDSLSEYNEVENTLLKRCYSLEPDREEELYADAYSLIYKPYQPLKEEGAPSITLLNSIALLNKYCAKLPSDTFTRLTPIWHEEKIAQSQFVCHIRLPINSPVKQIVSSPPMPNSLLARRAAAFLVCQLLHNVRELDDNLQPINKENFKASEEDWNNFSLDEPDDETSDIRPGTTKRRQYYYKRIADALLSCHPVPGEPTFFYKLIMTLTCPLPEEQNTRGRKIYPPEESPQGFGILTSKEIPKISAFPIFTRSGEVGVDLELISRDVVLTQVQIDKTREFVNYTFTSVLRLQKYLMLFNPEASSNNYLIVPTITDDTSNISIDWNFINLIYENLTTMPVLIPDNERKQYEFKEEDYCDAVVMPWYRNQDQPQYFYVAEICTNLNPTSSFPGSEYSTFEEYYKRKYNIQIQNSNQNLLDVDHTSARLNFLTPRYVNRKGVALPTSSEETKRAKRENLEQKQILVPELCSIHPFPASLWRKAVALPCVLYRINALLLADQIRRTVAVDLNLGKVHLPEDFKWPSLNFGWSLSDVLKKSREEDQRKQQDRMKILEIVSEEKLPELKITEIKSDDEKDEVCSDQNDSAIDGNEIEHENGENWVEIGTWCNEMAENMESENAKSMIRYASPTSWNNINYQYDDFSESDSYLSEDSDVEWGGLRIEFTGDHQAEALDDDDDDGDKEFHLYNNSSAWTIADDSETTELLRQEFHKACARNKEHIFSSSILVRADGSFMKSSGKNEAARIDLAMKPEEVNCSLKPVDLVTPVSVPIMNGHDYVFNTNGELDVKFSFDEQPDLKEHPGPSPNVLLQALTMSNANDGINLERLETIGDSFLKYAITNYLYSKYENVHEGKLSHLRSKQVSNLNLYRLGKRRGFGDFMIATKFDPHDNWLPPCFYVPKQLEEALIDAQFPANCWTMADMAATRNMSLDDICVMVRERAEGSAPANLVPYNLVTQHSIPDKSIADCVEAVIGAYLIECGPRGALLFMAWLGIRVLPRLPDGSYEEVPLPKSPLLRHAPNAEAELARLLDGYDQFERTIGYQFKDRSYLLQALTHASYSPNRLTDCYQRLEFLGDAVLDYLITRHLYEDPRMHSPGALTDLRSALVNNTIFASLAVRNDFHKYFKHLSPGLNEVVERFIRLQEESGHSLVDELYLVVETECEEVEDVEVPKALGDVFESVAGAIFLDSGMSLDAVWRVYHAMMKAEIEQFSNRVPKSPIRELLELEPETAKFGKPEKLADGRRVRVTVEVFGKGLFKGIGRNYRIAKCTAAKCALKHLKRRGLIKKFDD